MPDKQFKLEGEIQNGNFQQLKQKLGNLESQFLKKI